MTLQWTFVAACMYTEIVVIALLLLPFISAARWQTVFRSRIVASLKVYANIYFNIFIAVLVLLLLDSIREVYKYSEPLEVEDLKHHPEAETVYHMKLFRAQRNLYITGFSLFLWFILRRLVVLVATEATLTAESIAARRQAESATAAAQQMLDEKDNSKNVKKESNKEGDKPVNRTAENLQRTREQLEQTEEDLVLTKKEFEAMKKQSESVTREYDRLLEEHTKLQKKVAVLDGSAEGTEAKKDN